MGYDIPDMPSLAKFFGTRVCHEIFLNFEKFSDVKIRTFFSETFFGETLSALNNKIWLFLGGMKV